MYWQKKNNIFIFLFKWMSINTFAETLSQVSWNDVKRRYWWNYIKEVCDECKEIFAETTATLCVMNQRLLSMCEDEWLIERTCIKYIKIKINNTKLMYTCQILILIIDLIDPISNTPLFSLFLLLVYKIHLKIQNQFHHYLLHQMYLAVL